MDKYNGRIVARCVEGENDLSFKVESTVPAWVSHQDNFLKIFSD